MKPLPDVVWVYFGGYWREARVLEVDPPAVHVTFRQISGARRSRTVWLGLQRIRAERPKQSHRVLDMPAPALPAEASR